MAEEPLERLLVRRTVSRNVVTSLFTAMEFTRSSMEQDTQKHGRLWVLMDLLAKRIELLKALDEEILQAIDLTGMEPEILSTELFHADVYIRRALFQADFDSSKPPPTQIDDSLSSTAAGFRHLKHSSTPPTKLHSSLLDEGPPRTTSLPDDATVAVIGTSNESNSESSALVTSNHQPTPNCGEISTSLTSPTVTSVAVITACSSHPLTCITSLLPASTLESVTESLIVSPNPQLTTTDAPVSFVSSPTEENISSEGYNHTTVTDLVVQHCCYSTTSLSTVKLAVSSPCCREHHQLIRRINADAHLPITAYNAFNGFQERARLKACRALQPESSLVNYDPVLPHHPDRYLVARPAKPPPWLRSG